MKKPSLKVVSAIQAVEHFITIADCVSATQLLESVELYTSGLLSEDEFLYSVGFDIPGQTKQIATSKVKDFKVLHALLNPETDVYTVAAIAYTTK